MYKIVFTNRAIKDLKKMEENVKLRIARKLKEYTKEPLKHARKLIDPKIGGYRFRIGDYRIIFDIDNNTIVVLRVGHRKSIYK